MPNSLRQVFRPVAGERQGGPREIFRFELNSVTKVEFCLLTCTAVILKVLRCPHKSRRKRNPNEITDYFVCTANAHVCVNVIYSVPVCTSAYHMENYNTYNGSEP